MAEAYEGLDSLGLFLSGGADNYNPSDSLGGIISSKLIKGMSHVYTEAVQGLIIEDATPENNEGEASIFMWDGEATYTPPDGQAGSAVAIAEGERKILLGADTAKAVRIYRVSGETFEDTAEFELVDMLHGVISMSDIPDADRQAGSVFYRALFAKAFNDISDVLIWMTTDGQSDFAVALEEAESDDSIQEISDEGTAPSGLDWVEAVSEGTALQLDESPGLLENDIIGIWIRRTFPASGIVSVKEQVNFFTKFTEV